MKYLYFNVIILIIPINFPIFHLKFHILVIKSLELKILAFFLYLFMLQIIIDLNI